MEREGGRESACVAVDRCTTRDCTRRVSENHVQTRLTCLSVFSAYVRACVVLCRWECNREFGTVIRSLGCCPSEAEIKAMLIEVRADPERIPC